MTILGLAHTSLLVSDLPRSLSFYRDTLGLSTCTRPPLGYEGAWFDLGSHQQLHLLALLSGPEPSKQRIGRDRHLAFWVEDITALEQRLSAAEVAVTRSHSGRSAIFCRDPDGNGLEFCATPRPRPPSGP